MNKKLHIGYETLLKDFRLEFSRGGAYTCIALILLGVGLDYAQYPQMQMLFGSARIIASIFIYFIILSMKTKWGKDRIQWLTFIWLLVPQIMISFMIGTTEEGANSIYYAGLNLAMYAAGIVLAFGLWQNIIFGGISILLYIGACLLHPNTIELHGAFVVNTLFLLMAAVLSAVYTYFSERGRFILFSLKVEVAEKNRQLEETNKNLSDIKGHMLQQEKMASIGTLSAGLLHEINNPVNYCLMAVNVALEDPATKQSASLNEYLSDAKDGMKRVQDIVSDLKTFAYRGSDSEVKHANFTFVKVAESAMRLVGYETKDIAITCVLPKGTSVHGDEAAIVGVLVNLLNNAALAMHAAHCPKPEIHLSAVWQGGRLFVTVQDNGPGIAPENLARVFDPFFTTREVGQGLGLGLSISYGVIEQHGGKLRAESAFGSWTKMIFDLPKAA